MRVRVAVAKKENDTWEKLEGVLSNEENAEREPVLRKDDGTEIRYPYKVLTVLGGI